MQFGCNLIFEGEGFGFLEKVLPFAMNVIFPFSRWIFSPLKVLLKVLVPATKAYVTYALDVNYSCEIQQPSRLPCSIVWRHSHNVERMENPKCE